jgi:hypothetical protein
VVGSGADAAGELVLGLFKPTALLVAGDDGGPAGAGLASRPSELLLDLRGPCSSGNRGKRSGMIFSLTGELGLTL